MNISKNPSPFISPRFGATLNLNVKNGDLKTMAAIQKVLPADMLDRLQTRVEAIEDAPDDPMTVQVDITGPDTVKALLTSPQGSRFTFPQTGIDSLRTLLEWAVETMEEFSPPKTKLSERLNKANAMVADVSQNTPENLQRIDENSARFDIHGKTYFVQRTPLDKHPEYYRYMIQLQDTQQEKPTLEFTMLGNGLCGLRYKEFGALGLEPTVDLDVMKLHDALPDLKNSPLVAELVQNSFKVNQMFKDQAIFSS